MQDPGSRVKDPLTNLLTDLLGSATVHEITPLAGSEVSNIQLHELTNSQRDELAAFVARRRVVVFRFAVIAGLLRSLTSPSDQRFADQSAEWLRSWTSYFGRAFASALADR